MKKKRGKFIVLEGGEGTGKTTLSRALASAFGAETTHEPGGTPFAQKIREDVLSSRELSVDTQFALMWAARADHVEKFILPTLETGKHVICDRFDGSTYAYQVCAEGRADLREPFQAMKRAYLQGCKPDLYLVLDVPVEESLSRMTKSTKKQTVFDEREKAFHEKVRLGFQEFAELPDVDSRTIDASKPFREVKAEALEVVEGLLVK